MIQTPKETPFSALLRENGYRATVGRIALVEALAKATEPVSPERLVKALRNKLDLANTYRALESFTKAGIVRRVDVGHRHMHYELIALKPHHHHYVCVDCGAAKSIHA